MPTHSKTRLPAAVAAVVFLIAWASLAFGGIAGFASLFTRIGIGASILAAVAGTVIASRKATARMLPPVANFPAPAPRLQATPKAVRYDSIKQTLWNEARIVEALGQIDWYQFEKVNAAMLQAEGWAVQRKGGARPDGGKDLIARRNGQALFVQCKQWRTWNVKENIVRELLGSMSLAGISSGAIHTLHGFTPSARTLAESSGVALHDGRSIARRIRACFPDSELDRLLAAEPHLCPRCDAVLVLRTGPFDSFLGCPHYPRCRGKIEISVSKYPGSNRR